MANKDDDFDFKWDDDASFDSELDNFGGDVDDFSGDDVDDADSDRTPITKKLKSIRTTISDAGDAVLAGAGVGIGKAIDKSVPEIREAYNTGTYVLSEAQEIRNQARESIMPWWNETKRALRRLSQQLEGQMPFGLDKKILKVLGEEEQDQEYKQPSKEDMRREQMNSNIDEIFKLQMQKNMEQQRDTIINRTFDRRIENKRHHENLDVMSSIASHVAYQHAFTSSIFTAYLKKDLELKYKHFYVAEDTLEVFKNYTRSVESRLDAVIKNTALPEADKIHMSERIAGDLKKKFSEGLGDRLTNYVADIRKNIIDKIKESVDWASLLTDMISNQSDILEMSDGMDGMRTGNQFTDTSVVSKKGIIGMGLGWLGQKLLPMLGINKVLSLIPQETRQIFRNYIKRGGKEGLALFLEDVKNGNIKGLEGGWIQEVLQELHPDSIFEGGGVLYNKSDELKDQGAKFTGRFITTVEKIIPGYLAMQTKYLEMLVTHKDADEVYWDFESNKFLTKRQHGEKFLQETSLNKEKQWRFHSERFGNTQKLLQQKYDLYLSAYKGNEENTKYIKDELEKEKKEHKINRAAIDRVLYNIEHSGKDITINEDFVGNLQDIARIYASQDINAINELQNDKVFNIITRGIPAKDRAIAVSFWLKYFIRQGDDPLSDEARIDKTRLDAVDDLIMDNRLNKHDEWYNQEVDRTINEDDKWFLDELIGERDANGRLRIDYDTLGDLYYSFKEDKDHEIRQLSEEELKKYHQGFLNDKDEFKRDPVLKRLWKWGKEKYAYADFRTLADNTLGEAFQGIYTKFGDWFGDKEDHAKRVERAKQKWDKFADNVSEFYTASAEKLTDVKDTIFDWTNQKTLAGKRLFLSNIPVNSDMFEALADLLYPLSEDDEGDERIGTRSLDTILPGEWLDVLLKADDPSHLMELFSSHSRGGEVLRSVLPGPIKSLIIMTAYIYDDYDSKEQALAYDPIRKLLEAKAKYADNSEKRYDEYDKIVKEASEKWKQRAKDNKDNASRITAGSSGLRKNWLKKKITSLRKERNLENVAVRDIYSELTGRGMKESDAAKIRDEIEFLENRLDNVSSVMDFYKESDINNPLTQRAQDIISGQSSIKTAGFSDENIKLQKEHISVTTEIRDTLRNFYNAYIDPRFRDEELSRIRPSKYEGGDIKNADIEHLTRMLYDPKLRSYHPVIRNRLEQLMTDNRIDPLANIRSITDIELGMHHGGINTLTGATYADKNESASDTDYEAANEVSDRKAAMTKLESSSLRSHPLFEGIINLVLDKEVCKLLIKPYVTFTIDQLLPIMVDSIVKYFKYENKIDRGRVADLYGLLFDGHLSFENETRDIINTIRLLRIFMPSVSDSPNIMNAVNDAIEIAVKRYNKNVTAGDDLEIAIAKYDAAGHGIQRLIDIQKNTNAEIQDLIASDNYWGEDAGRYDTKLKTVNDAIKALQGNTGDITVYGDKSHSHRNLYADEHSLYINKMLTADGKVDYAKAIESIENIGRSTLNRQSAGKELAANALGEEVASNKELLSNAEYDNIQAIIRSAGAIRDNWSTSEDIEEGGIETLYRMLTTIYQNINMTNKKPTEKELARIYHAVTGKGLKDIIPTYTPTVMEDAFDRATAPNDKHKKFASGSSISFDLPIDKLGGYVDQPTKILGGAGIAGEAGGETIIPHKYNERFKELIYRCLKDTVGENMARKVLRMMKPSDATQDKLGINLSDAGGNRMFAKGGFIGRLWNSLFKRKKKEEKSEDSPTEQDKIRERIETIDAELADYAENNNRRADYIEKIRKEKADLESQLKTEDKPKEEYTQQHEPTSIRNILLNIMESNEAIYKKMGDGLLVVDLAAMLDKLKNTELLKKLKSLKIGEKIKSFIFGAYDKGKGLVHGAYNIGKNIVKTAAMNVGSFGRHMFTNKVCDVYLKSDIEGEKHGPKKIDASELKHGTIFADEKCTKPIYSVADIHPPVYRKKVDENGNTVVEEAIREDEAKDGLVDVEGNSLLRFGGKIGRFLRHVVTTPLKAIFTHKNWERLKGLGSSIMSGIGSGVNGFLDAYCDVYSKLDNAKEMLVSGEAIKEGRLVRIRKEGDKPKVVPTVFDIDGECWIMVDDPDNPDKRKLGNQVIRADHIKAGLCHKDGSPIESSKIAKAAAMLRRAVGAVGNGIASLTGGAFGIGATVISWAWDKGKAAAKWVKDRVKDAFTAKNPYIDVYVIRDNEKKIVMHADELKTNKATQRYCYIAKDGKVSPVLSAYGIDAPVYDMRGTKIEDTDTYDRIPVEIISQDDVDKQAIYDIEGNQLTKWAGRSLAVKIGAAALGAVKVGWKALKGLGKGLWNVGKTVLGSIGTLLGEGGAAVTGFFTKAWSSTLDFFRNSVISRKDLQEIVGDRLLDIYGLLYKYMPRRKYVKGPDLNNDGIVDGSWEDYEQKRKEREDKREQDRLDQWYKDHPNAEEHDSGSFWSKIKDAFKGSGDDSSGGFFSNLLDMYMGYLGFKDAKGLFGKLFGRKGAARATASAANAARAATVTEAAMSGKKGLFARLANSMRGLFDRPTAKNGFKRGKLYSAGRWLNELFFGNMSSPGGTKRGIVNVIRGLFHKKGAAAAGEAAASSATEAGKMATAWNWFKGLFGKGAAGKATEREIAALQAKAAAHHAKFMGAAAGRAATNAAAKAAAKGVLGRIGARLAAATTANLSGPVIGQIISAGMYLWTGYEIIKYFVTDSSKVKGLRPVRFKAYGVSPKYWEAIEDLETDTFSEFKAGHAEGVPVDRLKKFGYKIDFLDASEMAYGGDKLEYIKTWYRFKFVPFYQKYAQSIIIACKLDPNSQPKGDDIPDEVYSTIILQLTKGFDRINVGPLKELKLDKVSYEKWLAKKREKDREEGLESGKYNNKDLADDTLTGAASKLVGNVSDHLGYAWNEFKHGNILNAIGAVGKAHRAATVKLVAYVAQVVGGFVPGVFMGLFHNGKSTNEKAWDEVRFKLYGLDKAHVSKREYERISKLIKDFEIHQIHVIDGEEKMVEEDLRDLAEEIFTERVRKNIKSRLSTSGLSTIATSKDLYPESTSFVVSWYKRIFLPIFTLYANAVRAACGNKPGDNIIIDSIPADQRADLLKEFERQAKAMLAKNIDTEILRLSPDGLFDYLAMRSEEDIAEFAKDSKDLVSEDELGFGAKLSRNLDDAGNDLAKAWSLKFKDPGKALGLAIKGVGKAIWGTFKTVGKSIGQSVADFLHGSANEHRWETRFFDYGFTSRSGSSDVFKNQNLRAMEEFEAEAGKQLLEDNTGKPDEQFFVRIALNSGFIEDCCQKVFGSGSGIDDGTLSATNTRTFKSAILKYSTPIGWIDTLSSKFTNKVFGINTLSELKEKLVNYLVGNVKDNVDPNRAKLNIKAKIGDIINYLDFWWTVRFKPVFDTFIGVINGYGVEPDDIDVDNIPEESRKQAYDEYKKEVAAVLKKDNVLVYNLSAAGCAAYLKQLDEYRKDAKDGVINDARNPLAKYYKEKEEEFENTVVAAVVANAPALDKEEKFRVAKSLAKASMEIDSELNDVSIMSKYAAKDILAKLGVIDLIHPSRSVKDTIYSILLRLTIGGNYYDTIIENPRALGWAKTLGEVFVDFLKDAHECLYGTDEDNLDKYLKKFAELCTQSNLFIINFW